MVMECYLVAKRYELLLHVAIWMAIKALYEKGFIQKRYDCCYCLIFYFLNIVFHCFEELNA